MSDAKFLDTYEDLGLSFSHRNGQGIADCPFCGKTAHFYVSASTGQYDCKVCGETGNVYSYLKHCYQEWLQKTTDERLEEYCQLKPGVNVEACRTAGMAFRSVISGWVLPVWNPKGNLAGLRIINRKGKSRQLAGTTPHVLGWKNLDPAKPVLLCEGESDWLAAISVAGEKFNLMACTGANTLPQSNTPALAEREGVIVFDNDESGHDGAAKLKGVLPSFGVFKWEEAKLTKGVKDLRAYIRKRNKMRKKIFDATFAEYLPSRARGPEKISVETFDDLFGEFALRAHVTPSFRLCLLASLAVVISAKMQGDPLWLFIVGPPGSGKTMLLRGFERCESLVLFRSSVTPRSLVSGYGAEDDPSLILEAQGRCLTLKDYTEILSMPRGTQEEVYGVLRGAYDGEVYKTFGNGVRRIYRDCRFSMLAGVTDEIHKSQQATLGERFLKMEIVTEEYDSRNQIERAMSNIADSISPEVEMQPYVYGFLSHPRFEKPANPEIPPSALTTVLATAQLASILRATVIRQGEELVCKPRPEVGTRLAKQLLRLAICCAIVLDKPTLDTEILRVVKKAARDTAIGWPIEILHALKKHPRGLRRDELANMLRLSPATVSRRLHDMHELDTIHPGVDIGTKTVSMRGARWRLTPKVSGLIDEANFFDDAPPRAPHDPRGRKPNVKPSKAYA